MAGNSKRSANEPEPRPIIVKKIIVEGHGGHHGGAWKVAYADFVTAMMAFFLLMWLLGATTEKQRKGLADYFTPTLVEMKQGSAGSNGMFGGDSFDKKENYPTSGGQGNLAITIPRDAKGTKDDGARDRKSRDKQKFDEIKKKLEAKLKMTAALRKLARNVRFSETREGLRIDLVDEADFAMFGMGTDRLVPAARTLVGEVAKVVAGVPNDIIVRGHTDGLPYSSGRTMNNWLLSSSRADATREALAQFGTPNSRFAKIEGVADREPFIPGDIYDPRNRRMSIILAWSHGGEKALADAPVVDPATKQAIRERNDPKRTIMAEIRARDMGTTGLPAGAVLINAQPAAAKSKEHKPGK